MVQEKSECIVIADELLTEDGFVGNPVLRIRDGIITDISVRGQINRNVTVQDFRGRQIAPCFRDHHLHFFKRRTEHTAEITDHLAASGITTVCDGGDADAYGLELKKTATRKLTVLTAGHALYKRGAYGASIGRGIASPGDAQHSIEMLYQSGVDYIKVVNSGVFEPGSGTISPGGFTFPELKLIVDIAGAKGLTVACHANGDGAVREAIRAGVSSIVHGLGASAESLALMAQAGTTFIPTVNAFASLALRASDNPSRENIRQAVCVHLNTVKKASDMGVKVLPGSDSGPATIPYGTSFLRELELFEEAGIRRETVLLSAAARRLKPGAKADFLILDGLQVKHICRGGAFHQ